MITSIRLFHKKGKGTLAPWKPPRKLVISGPYRYIRNPMISGVLLILLGEAMVTISLVLFLWFLFFLIINITYFLLIEEPELLKRFGKDYARYKKNVAMFIPRFRQESRK
jgi:protein-S-isoprenylcysteine O-methyltransferase Ste14